MTMTVSRLASGLRVVSHAMPHLGTVALGLYVHSGARHEAECEHGISHLLEHMAFKGTDVRTARQIAEEIEQVGGDLNAATSLDTTHYYARVLKDDINVALDLLADIVQNPRYDNDELERERDVILQEIAATHDSPDDIAYDLLQDAAYTGQALGRPIIGTPASVSSFTCADLRKFLTSRYRASRMVLSAAGNVDHAALVKAAEALFPGLAGGESPHNVPAHYRGGARHSAKPFEQAHIVMGFEGLPYLDRDFYAGQVFSGLFGGGMSSRLFQEVREKRGLCYAIYSSAWGLSDAGMLSIHAATGADMLDELVGVIREEMRRATDELPTDRELQRSKAQIKAGLLMSYESSVARADQIARQLLAFDRLMPTEELIEQVDAVTPDRAREVARRMLQGAPASVVVVGAGERGRDIAEQAAARAVA
jgi:predicted Zn-dependent peptidase